MQFPAADLTVLSELIQQLALAQAANTAEANGGAGPAPAAPAPAPTQAAAIAAPTQAAGNANTAPLGYFRCPNCDMTHPLAIALNVATNATMNDPGLPPVLATPVAGPSTAPATPLAGPSVNNGGSWYLVTRGRQVGVFQGWDDIVSALVQGVPRWRCKRFVTEQQARIHYNHAMIMNNVHVYTDE